VLISFEIKQGYIKGTQGLSQFRQRVVYRPPLLSNVFFHTHIPPFCTSQKAKLLFYCSIGRSRLKSIPFFFFPPLKSL